MNEIKCHVSVAGEGHKRKPARKSTRDEKQYGVVEVVTTGKPVTFRIANQTAFRERATKLRSEQNLAKFKTPNCTLWDVSPTTVTELQWKQVIFFELTRRGGNVPPPVRPFTTHTDV
ncbi:hypothetical protein WN51_10814 [Melipona quadrifasciata]|uniref:Uncharacterized protein n=1 Tax=Melipona quadrifasciata TaxID=166423 RepID=A0A0N0U650_9HYME|nr:hypothetical protein WN51_10814 [Melipona quadrifasciata]